MFLKNDEWIWRLSIFFPCFEIGNWVCHTVFLLHETYCERNNYSSLLWYVGPSIWTQFKKKVKVTKSQKVYSIMSLFQNIDWNQLVSINFLVYNMCYYLEPTCQKTKLLFSWWALCNTCPLSHLHASLTNFWNGCFIQGVRSNISFWRAILFLFIKIRRYWKYLMKFCHL